MCDGERTVLVFSDPLFVLRPKAGMACDSWWKAIETLEILVPHSPPPPRGDKFHVVALYNLRNIPYVLHDLRYEVRISGRLVQSVWGR